MRRYQRGETTSNAVGLPGCRGGGSVVASAVPRTCGQTRGQELSRRAPRRACRSRSAQLWLKGSAALWLGLLPLLARGDERDLSLVAGGGYGLVVAGQGAAGHSESGGGGGLRLRYGLSETLALHAQGGAMGSARGALSYGGGLGLTYALDLLRVVPFFEVGLGVVGTTADGGPRAALGLALGLGADYVLSTRWSVGGALRYQLALSHPAALPLLLEVGPQLTLRLNP